MSSIPRALCACLLGLGLVACGDTPSPAPDAATARDAAADGPPDASGACATPNECPCFSNDDCPADTHCHAEDPEHVFCTPGPRGTGAAGTPCTGEDDCESALCVEGADMFRCSKTCTENTECPPELPRCLGGLGICAREP